MGKTTIEWTDATWNPIAGCTAVSPGCARCYALRLAHRLAAMGLDKYRDTVRLAAGKPVWSGRIAIDDGAMNAPLAWTRPRRVPAAVRFVSFEPLIGPLPAPDLTGIHWAIVGGESGPAARPMEPAWVEEIQAAAGRHGTAFFFKQWGGARKQAAGRLLHGRTWDEMPDLARAS